MIQSVSPAMNRMGNGWPAGTSRDSSGCGSFLEKRCATNQTTAKHTVRTRKPAGSCHFPTEAIPSRDAVQERKNVRATFVASAATRPVHNRSTRRRQVKRKSSPRNNEAVRAACNERTPLHASSTPRSPDRTSITFPCCTAAIPLTFNNSTVNAATLRINPTVIGTSMTWGHGTAAKMKHVGKAKCLTHGHPPAIPTTPKVIATTSALRSQATKLQSGFGWANIHVGKTRAPQATRRRVRPAWRCRERAASAIGRRRYRVRIRAPAIRSYRLDLPTNVLPDCRRQAPTWHPPAATSIACAQKTAPSQSRKASRNANSYETIGRRCRGSRAPRQVRKELREEVTCIGAMARRRL